ncbi:ABC transporter ATP-binding protein [Conexibacter woesei]|uniref:ATP-binding cassette domain-containing protein n=1 Tax=Conexibacter woesei TaxID=191495 RepID=UPI00041A4A3B|nr:ATP-binding cassette domain-containing protein [Conexibacter woesei]
MVFGPVGVTVARGEVVCVAGPGGSGRTALVLALAGRFKLAGGSVVVDGAGPDVRRAVAVARAGDAVTLDELWTVGDAIAHRGVLARRGVEEGVRARLVRAGVELAGSAPLWSLSAFESFMLDLALAAAEDTPVVVVDDVDRGLTPGDERRAWIALEALAGDGRAVIGATHDASAARGLASKTITLGASR